jgi:hypothetical protein
MKKHRTTSLLLWSYKGEVAQMLVRPRKLGKKKRRSYKMRRNEHLEKKRKIAWYLEK